MIAYFDTSAILPLVVEEPTSATAARVWLQGDHVISCRLVYPEARAALAMAQRLGRLSDRQLRTAVRAFESLHDQLDLVEITPGLCQQAGDLAERHALRGYDAVHLATAHTLTEPDLVFVSNDNDLDEAARELGISTTKLSQQDP